MALDQKIDVLSLVVSNANPPRRSQKPLGNKRFASSYLHTPVTHAG